MTVTGTAQETADRIRAAGTLAVLRLRDHSNLLAIAETLAEAGVTVMEVTFGHGDTTGSLKRLTAALGQEAVLGAGTVRSVEQVHRAADAGARFCVSPHTDPTVIAAAGEAGLASLPGAATATEINTALDAGAELIKLFPAGPLGTGYLRALRGPFFDTQFVPTGGIAHNDLLPWYESGASAIGLGADLIGDTASQRDPHSLRALSERAALVAQQAKQHKSQASQ